MARHDGTEGTALGPFPTTGIGLRMNEKYHNRNVVAFMQRHDTEKDARMGRPSLLSGVVDRNRKIGRSLSREVQLLSFLL